MNRAIAASPSDLSLLRRRGFGQLDVFPRIRVARRTIRREHIMPFGRGDARAYCIDERVTEHRDKIVVFQDLPLDLLCQALAFFLIVGGQVSLELAVELVDAEEIPGLKSTAFEH